MQSLDVARSHGRLSFGSLLCLCRSVRRHLLAQSPTLEVLIQKVRSIQAMDPFVAPMVGNVFAKTIPLFPNLVPQEKAGTQLSTILLVTPLLHSLGSLIRSK